MGSMSGVTWVVGPVWHGAKHVSDHNFWTKALRMIILVSSTRFWGSRNPMALFVSSYLFKQKSCNFWKYSEIFQIGPTLTICISVTAEHIGIQMVPSKSSFNDLQSDCNLILRHVVPSWWICVSKLETVSQKKNLSMYGYLALLTWFWYLALFWHCFSTVLALFWPPFISRSKKWSIPYGCSHL